MNDQSHLLKSLSYTLNDPRVPEEMRKASDTITRLTAEVRVRQTIVEEARDERDAAFAEVEKLRAALLGEETEHSRRIMEVEKLRTENGKLWEQRDRFLDDSNRLRAALEEIIQDSFSVYAIQVARAALSGDKQ
jgi:predicted nuclease with TOPRIM domain